MTAFAWLITLPLVASPVVYLVGQWGNRNKAPYAARVTALIALLATGVPFLLAAVAFNADGPQVLTIGAQALQLDGVSLLLAALALGLGLLVTLYSAEYMGADDGQEKYYAMLVMLVGVMIGLACATDLFNLWLWFEGMAVSTYLLVAFYRTDAGALEAGVKYLVQSAVGSVLVLLGIALVLAQTGTLDLTAIRAEAAPTAGMLAAGALFLIGFGVKVAMAPMHTWLPDAHSQAPSGISAMLSGVVIEAGLIALLRALSGLAGMAVSWGVLLMAFGALNMLVGNLMALRQQQVKRLLAYSSLSHVGYMLLGLGVGVYAGQTAGLEGGMFHMLTHGLMKGLAFLAAGALLWALHVARRDHSPLTVDDLRGAARRYPLTALALSAAVLALGGLPPLAGFMSKWQIFQAGALAQNTLILLVVIFAGLNSVLSLAYYAPLVNVMYRKQPSDAVQAGLPLPGSMRLPLILLLVAVVAIGFWPGLVRWLTEPAGAALLAVFGG
ncbi:MAG: proton-conducting transporter membrane subunit [Anaerolineae bacterium]